VTGISRFADFPFLSTLNNLTDISLDERYSTICGYTQEELESNFAERIDALVQSDDDTREQILTDIKTWYNGYSWDGKTSVYNPYSTLRLFDSRRFENFWFSTATPTFLIEIVRSRNRLSCVLGKVTANTLITRTDDPYNVSETILLFQTGYLTIKGQRTLPSRHQEYTLDFPNAEVRESFVETLLTEYGKYPETEYSSSHQKLEEQLLSGDSLTLSETLRGVLAWIPNKLIIQREFYYHSILLLWLRLLGFNITAEVSTNLGIIDAVWELDDQIFVAEIKYGKPKQIKKTAKDKKPAKGKNASSEQALDKLLAAAFAQIEERRYTERYKSENKKIKALAIACSGKEVKCEIREIEGI
jgi:hypothetical protein